MAYTGKQLTINGVTYTPLSADPTGSSLTEGHTFYSDGTTRAAGLWTYKSGNWVQVGSGSGIKNFYTNGDADSHSDTSDFSTGNNATFDGGGSLAGTFALSTTAADLIDGKQVFKYTESATALNNDDDYIASEVIDIPLGYRGRQLGIKLQYKTTKADDAIKWVVKDQTNTTILTTGVELLPKYDSDDTAKEFTTSFYCPADCTQVKVGPQIITGEVSKVLIWDEVVVTPDPFVYKDVLIENSFTAIIANNGTASITSQGGTNINGENAIASVNRSAGGVVDVVYTTGFFTVTPAVLATVTDTTGSVIDTLTVTSSTASGCTVHVQDTAGLNGDKKFTLMVAKQGVDYQPVTPNIVHHSTGTENTFSAVIANNGTASITSQSSPNNPAIASVNRSASGRVDITLTSGFFGVTPAIETTVIQASGDNATAFVVSASTSTISIQTEQTSDAANFDRPFNITMTRQGTDYKNPNAYAITPITQTAYLRNEATSAQSCGTATVQTVDINTVNGDTGFVSLSSNQFTIPEGKYDYDFEQIFYNCSDSQIMLYDVTNSAYVEFGESGYPLNGQNNVISLTVRGSLNISSPTTYEIRGYTLVADSGGLGVVTHTASGNPATHSVFLTGHITKLK